MAKRIHHMGMTISKKEHDAFHAKPPVLTKRQHDAMMKRMGITKEQDEEWHRTRTTLAEQHVRGLKRVNPFAVGAGFLAFCVKQGWLVQQQREYFVKKDAVRELREQFGIEL
jgi:hypothetical protein